MNEESLRVMKRSSEEGLRMGTHCEFSLSGSRVKPDDGGGIGPTIGGSGPRRPYVLGMSTTYGLYLP
jgi:hypothetical protein